MTTPDVVIILGVITTSIVTVINALYAARGRRVINDKADTVIAQGTVADGKLDTIHYLSNSRMADALARIRELEALVARLEQREQLSSLSRGNSVNQGT